MAIATEFIDFIVPIKVIEHKYPGGWEQCLDDHADSLWRTVWYDDHLFRTGSMSPNGAEMIVNEWTDLGFTCFEIKDGKKVWKDACIFEGTFGGATLNCDWLAYDPVEQAVYLKGTEIGDVAGRMYLGPDSMSDME